MVARKSTAEEVLDGKAQNKDEKMGAVSKPQHPKKYLNFSQKSYYSVKQTVKVLHLKKCKTHETTKNIKFRTGCPFRKNTEC